MRRVRKLEIDRITDRLRKRRKESGQEVLKDSVRALALQSSVPDQNRKSRLEVLADKISLLSRSIINIAIIAIASVFVFVLISELKDIRRKNVLLEPFEIASDLTRRGFSSQVISNKLADHINAIIKGTKIYFRKREILFIKEAPLPSIEVPATGISMTSIIDYIKNKTNYYQTKVGGELVIRGNKLNLTLRFKDDPLKSINIEEHLDNLDSLLLGAAQEIMKYSDPITLAFYLSYIKSDDCFELIRYCLSHHPTEDDAWALMLWSGMLCHRGDYHGAVEKINCAFRMNPNFAPGFLYWGHVLEEQQDFSAAIEKYRKGAEINPNFAPIYVNWAHALLRLRRYDEAIEKSRKAIELGDKCCQVYGYTNWAAALIPQEKYNEAIELLTKAMKINPYMADPYFEWGGLLEKQGDYTGANDRYRQASEIDPNLAIVYIFWSHSLIRSRGYDEAIKKINKAIEIGSKYEQACAYINWGLLLSEQNMIEEAIGITKIAIQHCPKIPLAYNNLGFLLMKKGDYKAAVENYKKYIMLDPEGPFAEAAKQAIIDLEKRTQLWIK